MSEDYGEDNHTTEMREDRNGYDQGLSRHGHQPTSDRSHLASTGPACQGEGYGPPSQMVSNSQAPQVFGLPKKNDHQSLYHQAQPYGGYIDWAVRPGQDRNITFYNDPEAVQEEPVSTDQTLPLIPQQQHSSSSFDAFAPLTSDYPALHGGIDPSTITASSDPVGSSTSFGMSDSETELSSWSVNNPAFSRPGWDGSFADQRDFSSLGSTYEQDDWPVSSDVLSKSFEIKDPHVGSGAQRRNQATEPILTNTSNWTLGHGNERMNTYGVHPSVVDPRAVEDFNRFQASVDATHHGGRIEQGESFLYPEQQYYQAICQVGNLGYQLFDDLANPTPSELYAPPIEGSAGAPTITMPRGNRRQAQPTRGRPGSGPVMDSCEKCGTEFTGASFRSTKRKHMRKHNSPFHYKCQLISIHGSPCPKIIKCATNRRRHVKKFHTSEAKLLPTKNPKRDPVPFLDEWFEKVRKSDE